MVLLCHKANHHQIVAEWQHEERRVHDSLWAEIAEVKQEREKRPRKTSQRKAPDSRKAIDELLLRCHLSKREPGRFLARQPRTLPQQQQARVLEGTRTGLSLEQMLRRTETNSRSR